MSTQGERIPSPGQRSLLDRLDAPAEAWRAVPGDKLVGVIIDIGERTTEYNDEPYPIVTVASEEGATQDGQPLPVGSERAFHGYRTVARRELAKLRPKVGERIGVAYHGKDDVKGYERYRIVLDRATAPDWERMEAQTADADTSAASTDGDIPF